MRRWSVLTEWVTAEARTSENLGVEPLVLTVIDEPWLAVAGALSMLGRVFSEPSSSSRYGGVRISPSQWFVLHLPHRPPPPEKTRPSGSRTATLWYVRGTASGAR